MYFLSSRPNSSPSVGIGFIRLFSAALYAEGVFLFCWLPFFSCNIMDAMCAKFDKDCSPGVTAFIFTTWLGYINSFVNPVIYTIFNPEFRKAFKKIMCIGWSNAIPTHARTSRHHSQTISIKFLILSWLKKLPKILEHVFFL